LLPSEPIHTYTYPLFQATKPIDKKEKRHTEKKQNTYTAENKKKDKNNSNYIPSAHND